MPLFTYTVVNLYGKAMNKMDRFISNFNKDLTAALFPSQGKTAQTDAIFRPSAPTQKKEKVSAANEEKVIPVMAQTAPPAIFRDKSGSGTQQQEGEPAEVISGAAPSQNGTTPIPGVDQQSLAHDAPAASADTEEGYLVVQVFTARSSIPLADASITITAAQPDGSDSLVLSATTDDSGKTKTFALPTPPISASEHPGGQRPYSVYNIRAAYPGFYITELRDVPVFPDRTTVQPINMIPFVQGSDTTRSMTCPENEAMCIEKEE